MRDFAAATTKELHLYADGTSGDDANSGRTAGAPKKTLQAVFDLVPDVIKHKTCVHLSGTFAESFDWNMPSVGGSLPTFMQVLVDGDDSATDVTGSGTLTATASSTSSLTVSGASWVANQWVGYFVRISDGPAAGQWSMIHSNTADTVQLAQDLSVAPNDPAFIIGKPSTEIQGAVSLTGSGVLQATRLHFGSTFRTYNGTVLNLGATTHSGSITVRDSYTHVPSGYLYDTAVGTGESFLLRTYGVGGLGTAGLSMLGGVADLAGPLRFASVSARGSKVNSLLGGGARIDGSLLVVDCDQVNQGEAFGYDIQDLAGFATSVISNASGTGIFVRNSTLWINSVIDISDCGSHGIEIEHSLLKFSKATPGSGNAGAGVYAHSGSAVTIKDGSPPTLTGTVGDFAVSNPAVQEGTWAQVDAGTKFTISDEMTLIKEV